MNITVQTTGENEYSLNSKSKIPTNTLTNIPGALLLNSSHKKKLWWFDYKYSIWLSWWTENILRGGVSYFLWYGTMPSFKHIKIWGVRAYIINRIITINNLDDRSHHIYFILYAATIGVIVYWNPYQPLFIHWAHHVWFDKYNYRLSI